MIIPPLIRVFGDLDYRGDCPTEALEQETFFNVLRRDYPNLASVTMHIKNEGRRTRAQIDKDKAQGLVTGASDIICLGHRSFVCELKRLDHTKCKLSKKQTEFLLNAQSRGAFACVALGWKQALIAFLDCYAPESSPS